VNTLAIIGDAALEQWRNARYLAAVIASAVWVGLRPRTWRRTVRSALAHQILLSGVDLAPFVSVVAILLGVVLVVQVGGWEGGALLPKLLSPLLVLIVAEELAPLFVNFVFLVKSGSAITADLGIMRTSGQVRLLEAQGIDIFRFLVMPRIVGAAVAVACLTILFLALTFSSSFVAGALTQHILGGPGAFLRGLMEALSVSDMTRIGAKTLLPAAVMAAICATQGLAVENSVEVSKAERAALTRSMAALFILWALPTLLVTRPVAIL
jgi:phospholipid/cholesterol/gamma-HCH transport system permease protein